MSIKANILAEYDEKHELYHNFATSVERLIQGILNQEGIICNDITSRLKDRDSLGGKIDKKNKYIKLDDLTDIAGIRVITYYSDDVDKVADIIEREFKIDRENSIDKRAALEPDRFGYCSVHYVVEMNSKRLELAEYMPYKGLKCEIQIRSVLQHAWAEIEHDLGYKTEVAIPRNIRRNFSRLAGLLEIADKEFQEIRQLLLLYEKEVSDNIDRESFEDTEIDAIVLGRIVKTDENILKFNKHIIKDKSIILVNSSLDDYESRINQLHWFDIYTLKQLKLFIARNIDNAIFIIDALGTVDVTNKTDKRLHQSLNNTVSLFFSCYAELITNEAYGTEEIMDYLKSNNIGSSDYDRRKFVDELLDIKNKIETA